MDITNLINNSNIKQLNEMQQEAVEAILHTKKDVVILSPTGSGKTLAYLLPLSNLLNKDIDKVQAIVVVPGRELALQSAQVMDSLHSGLRSMSLYGGRPTMDEHRKMNGIMPQIVFGTPGRLNDHIDKNNFDISEIKWIVLDEFDKCLEMGFHNEMLELFNKLPQTCRKILLSATDSGSIPAFVYINEAKKLDFIKNNVQIPTRIKVFEVHSPEKDKLNTLSLLLRGFQQQSSIVFLNYRESVNRVNEFLLSQGFTTTSFHGGMEQKQREDALYKFTNGSANIMVSTDLSSRGLDIPHIDNIIHYQLPNSKEEYIHRVGRTARWKEKGKTFFILGPEEEIPNFVEAEVSQYSIPQNPPEPSAPVMATIYIGKGKKDKLSKTDIVGFLCKLGGLKGNEIGRIDVKERYSYVAIKREKANEVLSNCKGQKIKGIKTILEPVK